VQPSPARYDTYDWYGSFATLADLADAIGANAWPTWRRFVEHPTYDAEGQSRAVPLYLTRAPVPTLTVGGWWDQEDIWGSPHTCAAMEATDTAGINFLVIGPWKHGQWFTDSGDSRGVVPWGSATSDYYRREIEAPCFAYWLKDKGEGQFPETIVFDAGAQGWRRLDTWPPREAVTTSHSGCGRKAAFRSRRSTDRDDADRYVCDPADPVPYRHRPIERTYDPRGSRWGLWMTEDQRFVDGQPDVLVYQTAPLDREVTLGEIMRGRYRNGWDASAPIPANTPTPFTVDPHSQAYTFRPGHGIMVQVQSTWFPVHDRNPQTFVPNIFEAKAGDYQAQEHRIHRSKMRLRNVTPRNASGSNREVCNMGRGIARTLAGRKTGRRRLPGSSLRCDPVEELVPIPVRLRLGGSVRSDAHEPVVGTPAGPLRQSLAVRVAGLREIRPVARHEIGHPAVGVAPRERLRVEGVEHELDVRGMRCARVIGRRIARRRRHDPVEQVAVDRRATRGRVQLDPLPGVVAYEAVAGERDRG
jgi:hypothetical protein